MPSLLILMPLAGIMILNFAFGRTMKRSAFWFAVVLFLIQIILAIFHHPVFWSNELEMVDRFFNVSFSMDYISFIALLSIGIVSLVSLLVARCSIDNEEDRFNFINLLVIASIGMSGIVMVKDVFSLYVFLEITAAASFILIAFWRKRRALEGAFKYILLSAIATIMMLTAIALLIVLAGDPSFSVIKSALGRSSSSFMVTLAVGIFICGLFIKGGLVPFHGWLPDAYSSAPAPVAILLAGIVTKVVGIYTIMRVMISLFGFSASMGRVFMFIGALSILVGAFAALGQRDFKRMLAYSSISQIGYILLGFGTGTTIGILGAVFHFFNHAIFKSLLFVNSAAVEDSVGTTDMDKMGGLASRMPITGATSVIALLSACGIPPLAGFWSKLIIILALWKSGHVAYTLIAVFASVLTLAYLLSMQRRTFFGKLADGLEDIKEAHTRIRVASIILAAITVLVGVFFPLMFDNFILPVKDILLR
ncbi:MAG: proton-conducting transporter membrane subunit [Candidatus Omnitrophica bacterium]|nr:proton-conducting transporter membrane subunit [Candidatus Omnitrophota bacterium]